MVEARKQKGKDLTLGGRGSRWGWERGKGEEGKEGRRGKGKEWMGKTRL